MAAFSTAAGQHLAAVGILHTLSKAMYAFAAAVLRLKCTVYCRNTFTVLGTLV